MKLQLALGCTIVGIVLAASQTRGTGAQRQPVQPSPGGTEAFRVGGGIPSGFMILGETQISPAGYTFTGLSVLASAPPAWSSRLSMPTARAGLASAAVAGRIYGIGGYLPSVASVTDVDEYDPGTNSWAGKAPMPTSREELAAAVVNGKILAIGGNYVAGGIGQPLGVVEQYDPVSNTWATRAPMLAARAGLAVGVVDGRVYAIGGLGAGATYLSVVEEYDVSTDAWITRASMPTPRESLVAAVVDGKLYAIGGNAGGFPCGVVEEYDPSGDAWSVRTSMPTPRTQLAVAVVAGKILAIGGTAGLNGAGYYDGLSIVEEYNPANDQWRTVDPMPTARRLVTATEIQGRAYVLGGIDVVWHPISVVEEYDVTPLHTLYPHQRD